MKQTQTQNVSTKTQTGSAPAIGAAARPVRPGRAFGRGLWPKAGVIALLLGTGLLTAMGQTNQPKYRFIELTLPGPGVANGINDLGLVTGFYVDPATGDVFSYLFENGVLTTGITAPGATYTSLGPPNNLGMLGGNYGDYTNQQPVIYDVRRGTYTPLPEIPGMPLNLGDGLNDFGHASGVAYAGGNWYGGTGLGLNWIWDGRQYSFFTVPGAVNGAAAGGINDWDQVAGTYVDSSGLPKGFVKDGRNYITLEVPDSIFTEAFGINNLGVVTGLYQDMSGNYHGYFWSQGTYVTVDTTIPGAVGALWYGSNDFGDLAGFIEDTNNVQHAVIAVRVDGVAERKGGAALGTDGQ